MTLSERAEEARETLFGRYDQLNALWLQAEQQLTRLHIPRAVDYLYDECPSWQQPSDPAEVQKEYLGLQKIKGKWRICHGALYAYGVPEVDWTPITDCSAETRVIAAKHLPGLRQRVVESAEEFVAKVDEAIDAMKAALTLCPSDQIAELLAERAKLNGKAK